MRHEGIRGGSHSTRSHLQQMLQIVLFSSVRLFMRKKIFDSALATRTTTARLLINTLILEALFQCLVISLCLVYKYAGVQMVDLLPILCVATSCLGYEYCRKEVMRMMWYSEKPQAFPVRN